MKIITWKELDGRRVWQLTMTEDELVGVDLDHPDRAVLAAPHDGIADVLQDLQLVAYRLESARKPPTRKTQ